MNQEDSTILVLDRTRPSMSCLASPSHKRLHDRLGLGSSTFIKIKKDDS